MLGVFFFFQAEDGIRDIGVTGVQTCALPIFRAGPRGGGGIRPGARAGYDGIEVRTSGVHIAHRRGGLGHGLGPRRQGGGERSEERRVGEEGRYRWAPDHLKKKQYNTHLWIFY